MPQPRELTDRYRLEKILGSSRGGTVLRAGDLRTGRTVAIKLITAEAVADPERARAFARYADELAALRHPSLPAVLDSGFTTDGSAFLVCELLAGVSLETLAGEAPERILPLLGQILDGLETLAAHGLAHHNLTPSNLLVAAAGEPGQVGAAAATEQVKLLGLGSAAFRSAEPLAASGEAARFQAPEIGRPGNGAGWQADLYSLAVAACQVLGATIVFGDAGGPGVQMPLALTFDLANDEALRRVLEACLRQDPAERPLHREVRDGLQLALGSAFAPPPPASPVPLAPVEVAPHTVPPLTVPPVTVPPPRLVQDSPEAMRQAGTWPAVEAPADWRVVEPPPAWPSAAAGLSAEGATGAERSPATLSGLRPPDLPHFEATLELPETGEGAFALPSELLLPQPSEVFPAPPAGDPLSARAQPLFSTPPEDLFSAPPVDLASTPAEAPAALDPPRRRRSAVPDELAGTAAQVLAALSGETFPVPSPTVSRSAPGGEMVSSSATAGNRPAPAASPAGTVWPAFDAAAPAAARQLAGAGGAPAASAPAAPGLAGLGPAAAAPAAAGLAALGPAAPRPAASAQGASGLAGSAPAVAAPAAAAAATSSGQAGELLSFDEELLNSLVPPAGAAAAPAAARTSEPRGRQRTPRGAPSAAAVGAAGSPPTTATAAAVGEAKPLAWAAQLAARLRDAPRPLLLAAAGIGLLVLGLAAFLLLRGPAPGQDTLPAAGAPPPPPPPPVESARAKLARAESYLVEGRSGDPQLRAALGSLTFAEQGALPAGGCAEVGALEQTLTQTARETVPADLAVALRGGDLALLARVVEIGSEQDVPSTMKADFARARSLVTLYREAEASARAGASAQVLQRFQSLDAMQKNVRDPQELRAHAAAALENSAESLGRDGKYAEALAQLEAVLSSWPERTGIRDLVKTYQQYARDEEAQKTLLDGLPSYERRRKPAEALDLMRDLKPTPHLAAALAAARKRLEDQLAQLDAQPPEVKLRDGYLLEYSRGTVVTLSFRVTDDYQVKSVKMLARPQGGRMREMPLQKSGLSYSIEIPPGFHQNGTVDFYVVATDLSGHEGRLGSPERPLQLKRRQGFEPMLR
jgi:hypothetical protein